MLPLFKLILMKKTFENMFCLLIIFIQISSIKSNQKKCYSILNCETCPELDVCEKCLNGFIINKPQTKCISKDSQEYLMRQRNIEINKKMAQINKQLNDNVNQKKNVISNQNQVKNPVDPFKNIPFKSIQQAKQNDLNRARINRLLIIIIIILAISIIISAAYDFLKKLRNNNNEDYDTQEAQEESTKVVIR